jgi:hypothetical protein
VVSLTGATAEDWKRARGQGKTAGEPNRDESCAVVTAALRTEDGGANEPPLAPWGVQLSGNFSKAIALISFERAQRRYPGIIGNLQPMIIGGVLRSRGTRPFYRVMVPEASRADADRVCQTIMRIGGACVTVRT